MCLQAAAAADRLNTEVQGLLEDRKTMQQREAILLDLLQGNLAAVASKPVSRSASRAATTSA